MKTYSEVKKNLRVMVMDPERHANLLSDILYRPDPCGLAVVPYVAQPGSEPLFISSGLLESWQKESIGKEQIIADAFDSAKINAPAVIDSLSGMIASASGFDFLDAPKSDLQLVAPNLQLDPNELMFCVTNPSKMNGAVAVLYPEVGEQIAEAIGGNYYVLPSSIHEVIIVKDSGFEPEQLLQMVTEINAAEVEPKDQLADKVFFFDSEAKELQLAASGEPETSKLYYWDEELEEELDEEFEL